MKILRSIPPAAAPLAWSDLRHAVAGLIAPERRIGMLEDQIREHFGARHVFLLSSGKAALTLTLSALKTSDSRTEVVIPAYTCFSVPAAVLSAGLRPVLCDIDPTTFDFDYALLERTVGRATLCVVAHHLFGAPSNVERTRALCRSRGIPLVEDAAQAMGVEHRGRKLGTIGDVGIFSLGRGKHVTCGSGGIIITRSDAIARAVEEKFRPLDAPGALETLAAFARVTAMLAFGRPRLYWFPAALPWLRLGQTVYPTRIAVKRLSGLQAGFLHDWRRRLAASNRIRCSTAAYFGRRLSLRWPHQPVPPYLRLPVFAATTTEKARLHAVSQQRGLGLSVAYPTPINEIPQIRALFGAQRFPGARRAADHLLTLPTHHLLTDADKRAIADCVGPSVRTACPGEFRHAS